MKILLVLLSMTGLGLLAIGTPIAIGVLLYYWGAIGLGLGAAAWIAFKVWATLMFVGVVSFLTMVAVVS